MSEGKSDSLMKLDEKKKSSLMDLFWLSAPVVGSPSFSNCVIKLESVVSTTSDML